MQDLETAKRLLKAEGFTCVLCRKERIYTSRERGVTSLVQYLSDAVLLTGYSAADKVVGKAAAMLFILAGIKAVYAETISQPALDVLCTAGVEVSYGILTERIINRAGTGMCPMEQAVLDIYSPEEAFTAIVKKQKELKTIV